jgi:MYXO-CTERM domain-containing protein
MWISGPDDPISGGYAKNSPGRLFVFGGTSGASPHVAGAAALLLQAEPTRTGDDVKQAIKMGALTDDATGKVPNDDFGHGKLRIYKSLYGKDPPSGAAPSLSIAPTLAETGKEAIVVIDAVDADEPSSNLLFDLDREYDGVYEERLKGPSFAVKYDAEGIYRIKVRVTDATGRDAAALALIEVKKAVITTPPPVIPVIVPPSAFPATEPDGCGCRTSPGRPWLNVWTAAAALLALGVRRRRAPNPKKGDAASPTR